MILINYLLDNINKYYPFFENNIINNITNNNNFSINHLHLYGSSYSMKNYYVYWLINKLTNNSIKNDSIEIKNESININNTNIEFVVLQSNTFIEFNLHNNNNNDKHIISNYIKNIISCKSYQEKHIIILKEFDKLSKQSYMVLRRIMEEYYNNVLFIFVSSNISKIPDSIKSRCINIRCSVMEPKNLKNLIINIINDYNDDNLITIQLNTREINSLIKKCDNDIYKILLNLESHLLNDNEFVFKDNLYILIKKQLDYLRKTKNIITVLRKNREFIYNLIYFNYDNQKILENFLKILLSKFEKYINAVEIIKLTAETEYNIIKSSREFYHYELYLTKIYQIFQKS